MVSLIGVQQQAMSHRMIAANRFVCVSACILLEVHQPIDCSKKTYLPYP
jgi:hypothetical protein